MSTQIVTRATRDAGNSGPAQTSQLEAGCIEQLEQFGALLQLIESALPDTAQAVFARALVTVRGPVFETDLDLEAPAVSAARLASDLNVLELVERFLECLPLQQMRPSPHCLRLAQRLGRQCVEALQAVNAARSNGGRS